MEDNTKSRLSGHIKDLFWKMDDAKTRANSYLATDDRSKREYLRVADCIYGQIKDLEERFPELADFIGNEYRMRGMTEQRNLAVVSR